MRADRNTGEHVAVIDSVRGISAVSVAFMHCRQMSWIGLAAYWQTYGLDGSLSSLLAYATAPFAYGAIGVPTLFVISGYVIHRRWATQLATGQLNFSPLAFYRRRLIRIYPTFLAAIALTFVCDRVAHYSGDGSFKTLAFNVFALQGLLAPSYGSNGALWSLAVELQFYAVYPLALLLRSRAGILPMLVISLVISGLGYVFLERSGLVAFPQYYFSWWLGCYLADRESKRLPLPGWWPLLPAAMIPLGCILTTAHAPFFAFQCWALGVAPLLAWLVSSDVPRTDLGLHVVGRFSYSLYATHMPIILVLSTLLLGGVRSTSIVPVVAIGVLTGLAAYLFYLAAERPFVRFLERERAQSQSPPRQALRVDGLPAGSKG